jgi:hypothetical protein
MGKRVKMRANEEGTMVRRTGWIVGMTLLCVSWTGGLGNTAHATTYDYGVGVLEEISNSGGKSSQFCFPSTSCDTTNNGALSVTHSLSGSGSGKVAGTPLTYSDSAGVSGTANLGDLHLYDKATGATAGGGYGTIEESWADVLTVGNNFASGTPLEFQVTLDLSGSVSATSEGFYPGGGSSSLSFVQSNFNMSDTYGNSTANTQNICAKNSAGKGQSCGQGWQSAPTAFSYTFTTRPGATIWVSGDLAAQSSADGSYYAYGCGNSVCYDTASAGATADFSDTSHFSLTPLTEGAFYTSASGVSYTPVADTPEPSTVALFGTGLLGLAIRARKKFRGR